MTTQEQEDFREQIKNDPVSMRFMKVLKQLRRQFGPVHCQAWIKDWEHNQLAAGEDPDRVKWFVEGIKGELGL